MYLIQRTKLNLSYIYHILRSYNTEEEGLDFKNSAVKHALSTSILYKVILSLMKSDMDYRQMNIISYHIILDST